MTKFFNWPRFINWVLIVSMGYTITYTKLYTLEKTVIYWDVMEYYSYLPALFIYHDPSLKFTKKDPVYYSDKFWPIPTPNGGLVSKMSMGMAVLYSPFFFAGHLAAKITGYEANGFTLPYRVALQFSCLFYLAFGLFFLRRLLQRYFSDLVTSLTIIGIVIGTNFYYYSSIQSPMSHVYSFSLIAAFIYLTIKWYEKPCVKNSILIGLLSGLIVLIRPTNIVILLFFIFWAVRNVNDLFERLKTFLLRYQLFLVMAICFFIVWLPQLAYWKYNTGQWFYYSYTKEKFFFNDPMIMKGLFSYRKGFLLYAPIMSFSVLGFIMLYKKCREFFVPALLFSLVNFYIIVCWWTWWYGGAYAMRPMIDSFAILAFPLASFIAWTLKRSNIIKVTGTIVFVFCITLSAFQTKQYYYGAIHWDGMTKEAYWYIFGKQKPDGRFYQLVKQPDYDRAMKGDRAQ